MSSDPGAAVAPEPRISVVIPTASRPRLVLRAVESALAQTLREIEVVVVLDGPDRMSAEALEAIADPRLRVIQRPYRGGPGAARNTGASAAAGPWIAFLDDDDVWATEKLALQLATAEGSGLAHPIVTCRVAATDDDRVRVWPRRLPDPEEPLGEYLLVRRSPFWGEALVPTSTLLVQRALLESVRFREDLVALHEDMDWLLRAIRIEGTGLVFVPDARPLATWNVDLGRTRASRGGDWRDSLDWARQARPLISRRAYAAFLLASVSAHAARDRSTEALWRLPWEAVRHGRPRLRDFLLFAGIQLLPESLRTRVADAWGRGPRG